MRIARALIGAVFIAAGILAITDTDVDEGPLWLIAAAAAIAGIGGLVSALRSERPEPDGY